MNKMEGKDRYVKKYNKVGYWTYSKEWLLIEEPDGIV
jgi:hypothetical protein